MFRKCTPGLPQHLASSSRLPGSRRLLPRSSGGGRGSFILLGETVYFYHHFGPYSLQTALWSLAQKTRTVHREKSYSRHLSISLSNRRETGKGEITLQAFRCPLRSHAPHSAPSLVRQPAVCREQSQVSKGPTAAFGGLQATCRVEWGLPAMASITRKDFTS